MIGTTISPWRDLGSEGRRADPEGRHGAEAMRLVVEIGGMLADTVRDRENDGTENLGNAFDRA